MNVPIYNEVVAQGGQPEILFWVGCAGSYDARAQKISRAFAEILTRAGISFAILGEEEKCTGDPARRAGNEFLFQILALQNIETLNLYKVKKIVCTCPHCFNTLRNEYPALGGTYEVLHHSQFLEQLLNDGLIKIHDTSTAPVTYHDSCYLGRINGVYEAPREVIGHLKTEIRELKRSRKNGLCCGAGGAQMFKEDEPGHKRINIERAGEVVASGSNKVVANCPFCITMLEDGIKSLDKQQEIMVLDLTELILENCV
ncbi:MAG: (Fe-S)-binding protein [Saprospiraceae bacterium]|nr:(Fe-S)-binding protein [Saprospiraceae bacterium]HMW40198.1 (Fe-S)-binding protein [Saprospiraceae bacterium]HMX88817.1 (Fe-S)-binding protein [Saprospiraceae bacterium]HMZ39101.1 (Fe-S)-binding protein [Saprospiraceae bacterium]HNA65264.1 (Fe-S)-binding protein [Saprospiraceae bacterium]